MHVYVCMYLSVSVSVCVDVCVDAAVAVVVTVAVDVYVHVHVYMFIWRCPICWWPKSRARNNRQNAAACFWARPHLHQKKH